MKIVITDGYAVNPGDLCWDAFHAFGQVIHYDRTPDELAAQRIGDDPGIDHQIHHEEHEHPKAQQQSVLPVNLPFFANPEKDQLWRPTEQHIQDNRQNISRRAGQRQCPEAIADLLKRKGEQRDSADEAGW